MVNPTRSAKTTETSLRSPLSFTGSAEAGAGLDRSPAPSDRAVPQLKQNRLAESFAVPQDGHVFANAVPQVEQKAWPDGFSAPQFPQLIMVLPVVSDGSIFASPFERGADLRVATSRTIPRSRRDTIEPSVEDYICGVGIISVPYFMGNPMEGFSVPTPHDTLTPHLGEGTPQDRMSILYKELAATVATTSNPVIYGGDCVSIIGTLAGLQRTGVEPTLIFFDAHGDFNTWETTPSGFIGGMPLAMVTGRGEQTIVDAAGLTPLPDERTILVDGRDLDPGEDDALASSGVTVMTVDEVTHSEPPRGPLHIHVDTDVVDPVEMPAENYPAPGGPSLAAVRKALIHLAVGGDVVAFSVSSWNPALPDADRAASATLRLAAPFLTMDT